MVFDYCMVEKFHFQGGGLLLQSSWKISECDADGKLHFSPGFGCQFERPTVVSGGQKLRLKHEPPVEYQRYQGGVRYLITSSIRP